MRTNKYPSLDSTSHCTSRDSDLKLPVIPAVNLQADKLSFCAVDVLLQYLIIFPLICRRLRCYRPSSHLVILYIC